MTNSPLSLSQAFEECRQLNRHYGTPLFHTMHQLPKELQPHLHGVYAFDRILRQIILQPREGITAAEQKRAMMSWLKDFERGVKDDDPANAYQYAAIHTTKMFDLPSSLLAKQAKARINEQKRKRFDSYAQLRRHLDAAGGNLANIKCSILGIKKPRPRKAAAKLGRVGEGLLLLYELKHADSKTRCYLPKRDLHKYKYKLSDLDNRVVNARFRELMEDYLKRMEEDVASAQKDISAFPEQYQRFFSTLASSYQALINDIRRKDYNVFSEQPKLGLGVKLRQALPAIDSLVPRQKSSR